MLYHLKTMQQPVRTFLQRIFYMNSSMMLDPDGAFGWNKRPDDLFSFLGKIHRKDWSNRCLGSVPGNSLEISIPIHAPSPLIQDFLSYCSTTPFPEEAVGRKQQPMKDAGQAVEGTARMRQARSKTGDKSRVSSTQGTGSRGAWSRRQKPAWVSSGIARQCV